MTGVQTCALPICGTLFLDEIGETTLDVQPKLLRFLESSEVHPIGETQPHKVDVRVIAATNADLEQRVAEGTFREDLYFRLAVFEVEIPPLRARGNDVILLADCFIDDLCKKYDLPSKVLAPETEEILRNWHWPGNIRELENTIERAVVLSDGNCISVENLMYHGIHSSTVFLKSMEGNLKTLDTQTLNRVVLLRTLKIVLWI